VCREPLPRVRESTMHNRKIVEALSVGLVHFGLSLGFGCSNPRADRSSAESPTPDFALIRERILIPHACLDCHHDGNSEELSPLATYQDVLRQVVPGDPQQSPLYTSVHTGQMPRKRPHLRGSDQRLLAAWISAGAPEFVLRQVPPLNSGSSDPSSLR
jgi:hypothetical protein